MVRITQRLRNALGEAAEDLEQMFESQAESIQLRALESAELRFGARLDRSIDSLRGEIHSLRDNMDRKFAAQAEDFDRKLERRFVQFLSMVRAEMDARFAAFDAQMEKRLNIQTRWIAGVVVAQSVAVLGYLALR